MIGEKNSRSHLDLAERISGRDNSRVSDDNAESLLSGAACQSMEGSCDVLLSAENIYRSSDNNKIVLLIKLRRIFPFHEIVPVVVFRNQLDYLDSLYKNSLRSYSKKPLQFDRWLKKMYVSADYLSAVEFWKQLAGREPLVLSYSASKSPLIKSFFESLNVDVSEVSSSEKRKNRSLDAIDCDAKNKLYNLGCPGEILDRFNQYLLQ
ncbi:hypothetical protein [Halomonas sp. SpR8]|uniref:hypothetical protein n=1 Tax=Halomonas sp. SpR8 TaxID=3050463 RepID=UPI0027E4DA19|nr:hypothetical protein [Halomonas sp. SpR8]MDQ7727286.1 hypothetical protein [Halomonas sp. SpR8]